jgi:hypothetical protein
MFLMLALISIASYGDSDDDFDNDAELEERMEQRSEDSEEDWEEDHYDTEDAEEEIEERLESRFEESGEIDDDLEDRLEDMFEEQEDHDDFEDDLEDDLEERMADRLEQTFPDTLDRMHQLAELDERLDDLEVLAIPEQFIELMDEASLEEALEQGADIQAVEKLNGLGQLLVIYGSDERPASAEMNHIYTLDDVAETATSALSTSEAAALMGVEQLSAEPLVIGMMDSSIQQSHECFDSTAVTEQVFYPSAAQSVYAHGTAMASVFTATCGVLLNARIYNAAVFGQAPGGLVLASAADLIRGLDWLLASEPDVINLSLSGPPNSMLEVALTLLIDRGVRVVASVGNEGPAAFPRYPAAQAGVIAVTAVDQHMKIYPRAVRGKHVQFSAPGVGVRLADEQGGFALKAGTSVAAALASAVLASGPPLQHFKSSAIDLGLPGFDEVYGYGLLSVDKNSISITE